MQDHEEIKRLEEMLLDATDDHFRCADCKRVFHDYDRYSSMSGDDCEDKYCTACGEMNERARAADAETYEFLKEIR